MVTGLEIFRNHFKAFANYYVIIGGTACDEHRSQFGMDFRSTKDIDLVVFAEGFNAEFGNAFVDFLKQGGYHAETTKSGKTHLYRFLNPVNQNYPEQIELTSRKPDTLPIENVKHVAPVNFSDSLYDFSAVVMDDEYYNHLQLNREVIDNLSIASVDCLMVLKAKAWLVLSELKKANEQVDSKNIKKHKNDFFRLSEVVNLQKSVTLSESIKVDLRSFFDQMNEDTVDLKSLNVSSTVSTICNRLRDYFGL